MDIELVTKFSPHVDEMFSTESRKELLTNKDYEWSRAHSVKVYTVTTASMNDFNVM